MKIVHIGSNTTGGAGLGMMGVHKALLQQGVDSRVITMRVNPGEDADPRISVLPAVPDSSPDAELLQKIKSKYHLPTSLPTSGIRLIDHPFIRDADIVHLHWISGMIDVPTFFPAINKPVVWTIRDENAMMGLYHFAREIPVNPTIEERELDNRVKQVKTAAINECRDLTYIALCSAMKSRIDHSQISCGRETVVIPNRIDTAVFKPCDRAKIRSEFGIDVNETVILFVAQFLGEKRKGLQELFDALSLLVSDKRKFTVLCVGNGKVSAVAPVGVKVLVAGPVIDQSRLAEFYSAADLFVTPSYSETFGKTTAEAIACGTPVVSFPNMGARDIVKDGVDGFLSEHFNPLSLSRAIEKALATNFDRTAMRNRIEERYSQKIVAAKHLDLYRHILETDMNGRKISKMEVPAVAKAAKKAPKLSIITICYNNADGLRETLHSTLHRQYGFDDFEQIVADGGSTDGTAEVLEEYKDRLAWYCSEPDNGIYDAMNKGASHARGDYLLFLNSGDILLEDMLVEAMRNPFNEDLVYSDILFLTGKKISKNVAPAMSEMTPGWFLFNSLPHQATFIRRELHEKLGGYDVKLRISAAPKFIFEALFYHHCSYRKLDCVFSRFDRSGISSQPKMLRPKLQEWLDFLTPYYGQRVAGIAMRWLTVSKAVDWEVYQYLRWHPEDFELMKAHIKKFMAPKIAREKAEATFKPTKKLSIITVNKNNRNGLEATLKSTLECQGKFKDFEQLVIDGDSSDGSREVIKKYASRIAWTCSEHDNGIYSAMNKGVLHSHGEYLLFLNSGDVLLPDVLSNIFDSVFKEDVVYADMFVSKNGKVVLSHQADIGELTDGWFLFNTLPHQASFIRRSLHNRIGGYDESLKISAAPKFFFDAVVRNRCTVRKLSNAFSVYDGNGISSRVEYRQHKVDDWCQFWKPYYGEFVTRKARQAMLTMDIDPNIRSQIDARDAKIAELQKQLKAAQEKAEGERKRGKAKENAAARKRKEVEELHRSQAYRTGMFVTWPARKAWGGIKCLKDNGFKYTVKHFVGKVARSVGAKGVKW